MAKKNENVEVVNANLEAEAEAKAKAEAEAKAKAEAEAKAKAEAEEQTEKTETFFISKTKANSRGQFVSINGRTWRVPTGQYVEVPECVAKVLRQSEMANAAIVEDKIAHSK